MSSKRVRLISLTGIILIALIIGASVLINYLSKDTREVPLPDTSTSDSPAETAGSTANNGLEHVAITKENVQNVIASLERPDFYTRSVDIEIFYEGDSTRYTISASVINGSTALRKSGLGPDEHIVIAGGNLYIWYDGDKTPYERPMLSKEDEKKSSDEYQMMKSYEDVLKLAKSSITAVDYKEYNGENCIYVQYVTDLLSYTAKYYISVNNGLLVYAEIYDGNTLVYKMSSSDYNPEEPDLSVFILPDGRNPVSDP
jgi:hypothetical protein